MKKIILVILSFFCFTLNPLAKEIIINDTSYEVSNSILKLDGLTYSPNNNLLTLTDANLNSIETTEDLKIILNGHNKLNNLNAVVIGGNNSWIKSMKEVLNNYVFIPASAENFDVNLLLPNSALFHLAISFSIILVELIST